MHPMKDLHICIPLLKNNYSFIKTNIAKAETIAMIPLNINATLELFTVHKIPAIIVAGREAKLTKELHNPKQVALISLGEFSETKVLELIAIKLI